MWYSRLTSSSSGELEEVEGWESVVVCEVEDVSVVKGMYVLCVW